MAAKSKILIIGGTGYIGKHIVEASAKAAHPTYVLVRETTLSAPEKSNIIDNFKSLGVNFVIVTIFNSIILSYSFLLIDMCRHKSTRAW